MQIGNAIVFLIRTLTSTTKVLFQCSTKETGSERLNVVKSKYTANKSILIFYKTAEGHIHSRF